MKTKLILIFAFIIFLDSCKKNDVQTNQLISEARIQQIAKEYNWTVSKTTLKCDTIVNNETGLINLLEKFKEANISIPISFGDTTSIDNETIELLKKKLNQLNSANRPVSTDPGYKYSKTVYFDNTFPTANYYVTINYNADAQGNITGATVTTGTWGVGVYSSYTQENSNIIFQNGSLAFQAIGATTTSVSVVGFSLTSTTEISFSGFMQLSSVGGGNVAGGLVTQKLVKK